GPCAGGWLGRVSRGTSGLTAGPCLGRQAGDRLDVGLRLLRQRSLFGEPILDALRARIVGSRSQSKIAELLGQIAQQACRFRYRLQWIERIIEAPIGGGLRHELRDAQRASRADSVRSEAAFLI